MFKIEYSQIVISLIYLHIDLHARIIKNKLIEEMNDPAGFIEHGTRRKSEVRMHARTH
jgi:hypothetical protein